MTLLGERRDTERRSTLGRRAAISTLLPAALVAISHGTNSPDGQAAIAALVSAVSLARPDLAVTGGFVDVQQPDVAASLGAVRPDCAAVVVPLLLSAGYHVHVDLQRETREHDRVTAVSRALGPDDRLIDVLVQRLLADGFDKRGPGQEIVLAAAGSSDARAVHDCRTVGALLEQRLGVRVTVGFLSAATPRLACAVTGARLRSANVTVSTYLMAPGFFFDLTRSQSVGADLVTAPLLVPGESAPVPLVDLVLDRYLEARERAGLF
ncbi:CbiX/SirB N-terminal domain-containing protein [Cryobacterium sp. PH31-L1]|uniref:sirohydrochlorin chelatase n=1 Tax=Cryobacterium sp. PH31-L1 TaxID=3046199 RepID=UPI0024B8CF15|nr:CbiX/SirB N-terminal domain-containing protein [Cryobacterium sp. PH31-L1]MDJ0378703.1 CbiX/SirB N-terminal domain-containing protein [Cryobacterium sp. PH31-L1]